MASSIVKFGKKFVWEGLNMQLVIMSEKYMNGGYIEIWKVQIEEGKTIFIPSFDCKDSQNDMIRKALSSLYKSASILGYERVKQKLTKQ